MSYKVDFELDLDTSLADSLIKWPEYTFRMKIAQGDKLISTTKHVPVGKNGMVELSLNFENEEKAKAAMQYCDFYVDVYWKKKRIATEIRLREPQQYKWYHKGTSPDYNLKSGHQDKDFKADKSKFGKKATVKETVSLPTTKGVNSTQPATTITAVISAKIKTIEIYYSGEIRKLLPAQDEQPNKYRYVYIDKNNTRHVIGDYEYFLTEKGWHGAKNIETITFPSIGYSANGVSIKWTWSGTNRRYIHVHALAAVLGALCDHNIVDFVSTGFSHKDGSPAPSKTHYNGVNGDMRYFRKDASGQPLHLPSNDLDAKRQIDFINSLYKYGYAKTGKFYSWPYMPNSDTMMPHCTKLKDHHHHLHIQGLDLAHVKVVKNEKN